MYLSLFVRKYRQECPQPRAHLHRHACLLLNLNLDLDINLDLDLNLNLFLFLNSFQSLFQTLFVKLFGSMLKSKSAWLWASSRLAPCPQMLLPRRPVGRGVGGRIVALDRCTTTYR